MLYYVLIWKEMCQSHSLSRFFPFTCKLQYKSNANIVMCCHFNMVWSCCKRPCSTRNHRLCCWNWHTEFNILFLCHFRSIFNLSHSMRIMHCVEEIQNCPLFLCNSSYISNCYFHCNWISSDHCFNGSCRSIRWAM